MPQPDSPTSPSVSPRAISQADAGHRMDHPAADGIFDDEIFHPEQGIARRGWRKFCIMRGTPAAALIGWKQAYW